MASRSHRSPRRSSRTGRRTALVSAVAVAAVGLVASLVMAFGPDRETEAGGGDAGKVTVTSAAGARVSDRPTQAERKSPPPSPSPTATTADTPTPSATPPSKSPKPRATSPERKVSATAPLAGRIRPQVTYQGVATLYDAGNGDGACSYGPTDDLMIAAMNTTDYETSKACGAYVLVRAAGGATVTVRITNECPAPCKPGQLDLSAQAFAKLADPSRGQIPITWSLLSPGSPDTLSIRYKTGSSRHWCGIQVIGHRNPVARLEVRTGSGWTPLPRTEYNYFLSERGAGCGGAIRVTDIHGERLTVDGIAVRPDVVQPTRVQFTRH